MGTLRLDTWFTMVLSLANLGVGASTVGTAVIVSEGLTAMSEADDEEKCPRHALYVSMAAASCAAFGCMPP
eukprot:4384130-Amphidinium_carterae.1